MSDETKIFTKNDKNGDKCASGGQESGLKLIFERGVAILVRPWRFPGQPKKFVFFSIKVGTINSGTSLDSREQFKKTGKLEIRKEVKNIPEETKCRRREICEALLSVNHEIGVRAALRNEACTVLKGWNAQESQIAALEKLGFGVTKGRKHYKLRRDNSAFFTSVSATPSDKRAGANLTAEFVKLFL